MNLPDLARRSITEELVEVLARMLHERPQQVWASVSAAVPTILWFYVEKVQTPEGADELSAAAMRRDPKILDRLAESLSGEKGPALLAESERQFTSLFNREATDAVVHGISAFSGMGVSSARPIVGVTHLIALASLRKEAGADNGRDLARFIGVNRPSIVAAIPAGLHEQMESIPRLHQLAHPYDEGVPATASDDMMEGEAQFHRQETAPAERRPPTAELDRMPSALVWAIPILVALAIGCAMLFAIYPRNADNPVAIAPTNPPVINVPDAQPAAAKIVDVQALRGLQLPSDPSLGPDLAAQLDEFDRGMSSTKSSVSLPELSSALTHVNQKTNDLLTRFRRLPADQQQRVGAMMSQLLPGVQSSAREATGTITDPHMREQIGDIMRILRELTQQPV